MTLLLTDLFGDSDECRILKTFVENPEREFLLHQVMLMAEAGVRDVARRHITKLLNNNIIIMSYRDINGKCIEVYKLNTDDKITGILVLLESAMVLERVDQLFDESVEHE